MRVNLKFTPDDTSHARITRDDKQATLKSARQTRVKSRSLYLQGLLTAARASPFKVKLLPRNSLIGRVSGERQRAWERAHACGRVQFTPCGRRERFSSYVAGAPTGRNVLWSRVYRDFRLAWSLWSERERRRADLAQCREINNPPARLFSPSPLSSAASLSRWMRPVFASAFKRQPGTTRAFYASAHLLHCTSKFVSISSFHYYKRESITRLSIYREWTK